MTSAADPEDAADLVLPEGSADYLAMLRLATRFQRQQVSFAQLQAAVAAAKLPPHPLGCAYLTAPVPAPPPGTPFEPARMPADWKGTFGEVAMTFWAGALTRAEYDAVHRAAHAVHPGFPDCRPARVTPAAG